MIEKDLCVVTLRTDNFFMPVVGKICFRMKRPFYSLLAYKSLFILAIDISVVYKTQTFLQ